MGTHVRSRVRSRALNYACVCHSTASVSGVHFELKITRSFFHFPLSREHTLTSALTLDHSLNRSRALSLPPSLSLSLSLSLTHTHSLSRMSAICMCVYVYVCVCVCVCVYVYVRMRVPQTGLPKRVFSVPHHFIFVLYHKWFDIFQIAEKTVE